MNEPPGKTKSLIGRLRSLPLSEARTRVYRSPPARGVD
jgi:hypothetical protein